MGFRYCTECKEVGEVKVLSIGYSQVAFNGIQAKRRKVIHREEDGGCGHELWTLEIPEEFLPGTLRAELENTAIPESLENAIDQVEGLRS